MAYNAISACRLYRHAEQTLKNEGIFCEFELVGVRGYGRVQIRKKQVTPRETRCFSWRLNLLLTVL